MFDWGMDSLKGKLFICLVERNIHSMEGYYFFITYVLVLTIFLCYQRVDIPRNFE